MLFRSTEIGKGIGTELFIATRKQMISLGKKNMIIWCLSDNINAIRFYEKLGGKIVKTKDAQIGDKNYTEYGFYFHLN